MIRLVSICLLFLVPLTATPQRLTVDIAGFDRERVIKAAEKYLSEKPITITAAHSSRSRGGLHDFFSGCMGDYPGQSIREARQQALTRLVHR
jgi:hypothetical protein